MTQENFVQIPKNWILFSDLITNFDNSATYQLYNNGVSTVKCLESDTLPTDNAEGGLPLYQNRIAIYKKGTQNLYIKALSNDTYINITKVG